jgi:3-hydroxyacyl-CoA dehydrogenase
VPTDLVRVTIEGDVAVVQIDNPPVNALSAGVPEGLAAAMQQAAGDPSIGAVVLIGAGKTFVAGADIKELERSAWDDRISLPDISGLLRQIEDMPKPVVVAIHGTALGGGVELAMAGHYRIATPDARIGLPEVTLGIIPGAQGTQRLPRLVGIETALDLIVSGRLMSAPEALTAGLVDRIADGDLLTSAMALAREVAGQGVAHRRTRDRRDRLGTPETNGPLYDAARQTARKARKHQIAPLLAVDAIEAAATLPFDEGCRRERELCMQCVRSEPCKALMHAFLAERGVSKIPGIQTDAPPRTIDTVAIIGAGTMGSGIAMACANAGLRVVLTDVGRDRVDAGIATIRRNYDSSVKRGRLTADAADQRMGAIHGATGYDACAEADLVIEAVFENMALKKEVFATIDRIAKAGAILATNTSTLDVDAIAAATRRPEDVVGLHFFSPAHVMRLVEIVRGRATSPPVLAASLALTRRLKKIGVVVRNAFGFVGNRMMFPYMYEAQFLVEDGATPEQVDRVLTDWGMAMGIFAVDDLGGLDVAWRVRHEVGQFDAPGLRKPLVSDALVDMHRLGQKTGKGWYRYEQGDRKPILDPEVLAVIDRVTRDANIVRRPIEDQEIFERTIYALINEGARVLEEGIAMRAADIDVIYVNGYGFPAFRGGPMFYADRAGLSHIHDRIAAFHREFGERWTPAPLLARLAREGRTFRDLDAGAAV